MPARADVKFFTIPVLAVVLDDKNLMGSPFQESVEETP